ncbi:MAG: UGSC family (seleno)protein [Candidatus Dormibacteria bacterium]
MQVEIAVWSPSRNIPVEEHKWERLSWPTRVALVDNSKAGADIIVSTLAERLAARGSQVDIVLVRKQHASLPITSDQLDSVGACDVALLALGDCGSCTSWTIQDACMIEQRGTPAIALCTRPFEPFAREQASVVGNPSLHILVLDHPIAEQARRVVLDRVAAIAEQFDDLFSNSASNRREAASAPVAVAS